jgi:hypothetical protein
VKKFIVQVGKNLVPPQHLNEIDKIDKMLDKHGEKRRAEKFFFLAPPMQAKP